MTEREYVEYLMLEKFGNAGKLPDGKGYDRIAFGDEDWKMKLFLMDELRRLGMSVRMDPVGNIIGRVEGTEPGAPAVCAGSHSDSVPGGGNYDGSVGVVGALCAVRRIMAKGPTKRPLEVWVFAGHESSRFGFNHLGSKSISGISEPEKWADMVDIYGKTVKEVLAQRGLDLSRSREAERDPKELYSFFEMHIDCGPVLYKRGIEIGVIDDNAAPIRLSIKFSGEIAHSGATPIEMRKDALLAASHAVISTRKIAEEYADQGIIATIGRCVAKPGVMNCVPGEAELWLDLRGRDYALMEQSVTELKAMIDAAAEEEGVSVRYDLISASKPTHFDDGLHRLLLDSAEKTGHSAVSMICAGGHDTCNINRITRSCVIHIPAKDGLIHDPREYSSTDQILAGIDVLEAAMIVLANE